MSPAIRRILAALNSASVRLFTLALLVWLVVGARETDLVGYLATIIYPPKDSLGVYDIPLGSVSSTDNRLWDLVLVRQSRTEVAEINVVSGRADALPALLLFGSAPRRSTATYIAGHQVATPYSPIIELEVPRETTLGVVIAAHSPSLKDSYTLKQAGIEKNLDNATISMLTPNEFRNLRLTYLLLGLLLLIITVTLPRYIPIGEATSRSPGAGSDLD